MHVATPRRTRAAILASLAALALASPRAARAQSGDGFLFGTPHATLGIRGGFDRARAGGQLIDQTIEDFSLSRGSFSSGTVAADLAVRASSRFAIVGGTSFSDGGGPSHMRHKIGSDDREIEQSTTFRRIPVTLGLRAYLVPPGRSIGRYAWVPARVAPYVGVGGGYTYYKFRQSGEFSPRDLADPSIYRDNVQTSGWARTAHGLAGLEYTLSPRVALTGEARYTWARGAVGNDYAGFDRIDLGGLVTTVGLALRL